MPLFTRSGTSKGTGKLGISRRFLARIGRAGGFAFYVGVEKTIGAADHNSNNLYRAVLREAIKRLDQYCGTDCAPAEEFLLVMDEHDQRSAFITESSMAMYNPVEPRRTMIEPPFQVESHRYQTLQAADWISGLVGRLGAVWTNPAGYPENEIFQRYFEGRLHAVSRRSGIRRLQAAV